MRLSVNGCQELPNGGDLLDGFESMPWDQAQYPDFIIISARNEEDLFTQLCKKLLLWLLKRKLLSWKGLFPRYENVKLAK